MNFKNLDIASCKKYIAEMGLRPFYEAYLPWLKKEDARIHGFLLFTDDLVWKTIDELEENSKDLPLHGVPVAIKDNMLVAGYPCTSGSKMLEDYVAPYDATVITKLKEAGAVIVGKTNMDEFAMGSSTETSAFGPTFNPHDITKIPGGSSGGSAAVVGGGLVPIALGSDTGGSIRQPAGFCGCYGLKPTYGAVSRYGVMAMASSLDQIGPFARTAADAQLLFDVIKGPDIHDSTSVTLQNKPVKQNPTLGLPKEFFTDLNPDIKKVILDAIKKTGLSTKEVSLPSLPYSLACYYLIVPAEVSANMARFDGVRYGLHEATKDVLQNYLQSRKAGLGKEVIRRIMLGTFILSHGYYDAYYLKAQCLRKKIVEDFQNALSEVDLIISPVSPTQPFSFGEKIDDPIAMYLSDIYTVPINLAYIPSLTVPVGTLDNMPLGMQIIGNNESEPAIFSLASLLESSLK